MDDMAQTTWVPLTPRRVAVLAHARKGRLLLVQLIMAAMVALIVGWFLYYKCFPTVSLAIDQLPTEGQIQSRELDWRGPSPQMLAEGRLLALTVDLDHSGGLRSSAHVQAEFGKDNCRIRSLLGIMDVRYPEGWLIAFNRAELKPLWGAWRPALLLGAMAGTAVGLMLFWWSLSAIYSPFVWFGGVFVNRDLNLPQSWQLAGAALMPGAVIMTAAIVFFGLGMMDLVGLLFFFCAHFAMGWVYLFLSLLYVPKTGGTSLQRKNPFAATPGHFLRK